MAIFEKIHKQTLWRLSEKMGSKNIFLPALELFLSTKVVIAPQKLHILLRLALVLATFHVNDIENKLRRLWNLDSEWSIAAGERQRRRKLCWICPRERVFHTPRPDACTPRWRAWTSSHLGKLQLIYTFWGFFFWFALASETNHAFEHLLYINLNVRATQPERWMRALTEHQHHRNSRRRSELTVENKNKRFDDENKLWNVLISLGSNLIYASLGRFITFNSASMEIIWASHGWLHGAQFSANIDLQVVEHYVFYDDLCWLLVVLAHFLTFIKCCQSIAQPIVAHFSRAAFNQRTAIMDDVLVFYAQFPE